MEWKIRPHHFAMAFGRYSTGAATRWCNVPAGTTEAIVTCRAAAVGLACCVLLLGPRLFADAQQLREIPQAVERIYAALPDLPQENQYVAVEDGPQPRNTFVRRFLAYHLQTQGRSPYSRLDWKLTFADYLEANAPIYAASYPGAETLTVNPLNRDRQIVQGLSRGERRALLAEILAAFGADARFNSLDLAAMDENSIAPAQTEEPTEPDSVPSEPDTVDIAVPGSADLLRQP